MLLVEYITRVSLVHNWATPSALHILDMGFHGGWGSKGTIFMSKYGKNTHKNTNTDRALKNVRTEVSDPSLSDEESRIIQRNKKDPGHAFTSVHQRRRKACKRYPLFAIQRGLLGLAVRPQIVNKLKNVNLTVTQRPSAPCLSW